MTQTQECFKLYASKIQMCPFIYLLTPVAGQSRDMKHCSTSNSQKIDKSAHIPFSNVI